MVITFRTYPHIANIHAFRYVVQQGYTYQYPLWAAMVYPTDHEREEMSEEVGKLHRCESFLFAVETT